MSLRLYPHLKNLRPFFVREVILIAMFVAIGIYFVPHEDLAPFIIFASICIALEWVPAIILIIMYYRHNRNQIFVIRPASLSVVHGGSELIIKLCDIEKLVVYMSRNNPRFGVAFHSVDILHFVGVLSKMGDIIVITSICADQVDEILESIWVGVPVEYNWGLPRLGKVHSISNESTLTKERHS